MSQADTQLAPEGDDLESIAASMGDAPAQDEQEEELELDAPEVVATADDEDPEWEIEVDGKPQKIKKSEAPDLIRRGMFEADYRKKTAEAAEQRRKDEDNRRQLEQRQQFVASQLEVYVASLHRELVGSQPDPKLIDEDPQEFMRQQTAYNARAQQFQQAMQYRQVINAQQEQESQRQRAEVVQQENERLLEAMPELRDEKVRTEAFSGVARFLQSAGYTPEEMNALTDHRAVMVAMKAAKYDQLQAAKAKQAKPEVPKPVKPGATQGNQPNTRLQRAHERLKRDPNDLDALSELMG